MFGLFDICKHPKAPVHAGKPFLWASILNAYAISTAVASVAVISWEDWDGQVVKPNPTQIVLSSLGLGLNIISAIAIIFHINNRWISETIKLIFVSSLLSAIFHLSSLLSFYFQNKSFGHYTLGFTSEAIAFASSVILVLFIAFDWFYLNIPHQHVTPQKRTLIVATYLSILWLIIGAFSFTGLEKWSYETSYSFCIISLLTIGYGNVTPKSTGGRIFLMIYATFGLIIIGFLLIAIKDVILENVDELVSHSFIRAKRYKRRKKLKTALQTSTLNGIQLTEEDKEKIKYQVLADEKIEAEGLKEESLIKIRRRNRLLIWMIIYWIIGAECMKALEPGWTQLDSFYFTFVTITTIGYGDLHPTNPRSWAFINSYSFFSIASFAFIISIIGDSFSENFSNSLISLEDIDENSSSSALFSTLSDDIEQQQPQQQQQQEDDDDDNDNEQYRIDRSHTNNETLTSP